MRNNDEEEEMEYDVKDLSDRKKNQNENHDKMSEIVLNLFHKNVGLWWVVMFGENQ